MDSSDIEQLGRRRDDVDIADPAYIRELEQRAQQRAEDRLQTKYRGPAIAAVMRAANLHTS